MVKRRTKREGTKIPCDSKVNYFLFYHTARLAHNKMKWRNRKHAANSH
uniref:Uncharacterized protein n=1 Tax=Rhizophora mucronata TaxID=61149 RepID=A0A2P2NIT0_RHIMU